MSLWRESPQFLTDVVVLVCQRALLKEGGGGVYIFIESKAAEGELLNLLPSLSTILDVPYCQKILFRTLGRLAEFLSSLKKLSGACMNLILKWGHIILGSGSGEFLRVRLLLVQWLPTQQEGCSLALMRLATDANNSVLVVVRSAFTFTTSSRTPFLVVAASARASKYSSRSASNPDGTFACGF